MPEPSIKGSAFVGVVADLKQLVTSGSLTRERLEERLEPADLELLDAEISPGFWYPMASYDRMLDLLVHEEGGDSLEKGWTRLCGRVMMTVASVVYNFLTFEINYEATPDAATLGTVSDRFTILIRDGGRLSNHACMTIEGAVAALAARAANGAVKVWSRRVATDEVEVYTERRSD